MENKGMKKCHTSYDFRELQTETKMRYHYTPLRMATSRTLSTPNARVWSNRNSLIHGRWEFTATLGDSLTVSYKTKHTLCRKSTQKPAIVVVYS